MSSEDWKKRVYDSYVSSSHLTKQADPKELFGSRAPYIEHVVKHYIPQAKDIKVLELACGPAPFLYFLKGMGYLHLVGVDVSPEQVAIARALGLDQVQLQDMMAFLDEADKQSFDVVILFDILEHFGRRDQLKILDKVFAVLKPGGICILHVPNAEGYCGTRILYSDITHETSFTPRSIRQMLALVGFAQVQCIEDKPLPHGILSMLRRIIWEISMLGWRITLSAETGTFPTRFILSQNMLVLTRK